MRRQRKMKICDGKQSCERMRNWKKPKKTMKNENVMMNWKRLKMNAVCSDYLSGLHFCLCFCCDFDSYFSFWDVKRLKNAVEDCDCKKHAT